MHKAFVNGLEGGLLELDKASDDTFNVYLIDIDNIPVDTTGATITFEIYDFEDRRNAASKAWAAVLNAAPTSGVVSVTVTPSGSNGTDVGPGTYYGFVKVVDAGAGVTYSRIATLVRFE